MLVSVLLLKRFEFVFPWLLIYFSDPHAYLNNLYLLVVANRTIGNIIMNVAVEQQWPLLFPSPQTGDDEVYDEARVASFLAPNGNCRFLMITQEDPFGNFWWLMYRGKVAYYYYYYYYY